MSEACAHPPVEGGACGRHQLPMQPPPQPGISGTLPSVHSHRTFRFLAFLLRLSAHTVENVFAFLEG